MNPPLPLREAQQRLLDLVIPTPVEAVAPHHAHGRYLAAPLIALATRPNADLSAMDGFAVSGSGPWKIVGESRCGVPHSGPIAEGEATQISTGAHVPVGADAIVLIEEADLDSAGLVASDHANAVRYFRKTGSDFHHGDTLLPAGTRIGPSQLALALMSGAETVQVHAPLQITILESGDELCVDPAKCQPHQIPATNGAMLRAMAMGECCEVKTPPPVADSLTDLIGAIEQSNDARLLVISGGASVGEHDLVRPALQQLGVEIDFWRVAMKPGKPLMVARRGEQLILGLPGNPVSSYVTAFLFMLPAIRSMLGSGQPLPRSVMLSSTADLDACGPRRTFMRAIADGGNITPLTGQVSGALAALASANALIERAEGSSAVKAGTDVPAYLLQNGGIA